jgi:hypothetical protein
MAMSRRVATSDGQSWAVFCIGGVETLSHRADWIVLAVSELAGVQRSFISDQSVMDISDDVLSESIEAAEALSPEIFDGWQMRPSSGMITPPARSFQPGKDILSGIGKIEMGETVLLKTKTHCDVSVRVMDTCGTDVYFGVVSAVKCRSDEERDLVAKRVAFHERHVFAELG